MEETTETRTIFFLQMTGTCVRRACLPASPFLHALGADFFEAIPVDSQSSKKKGGGAVFRGKLKIREKSQDTLKP